MFLTDHVLYLPPYAPTDRPLLAAILGTRRTLMVDAGASPSHAEQFLSLLHEATGRRPDFVVLTHWHWDHTFGLAHLGLPAVAHRAILPHLRALQGLAWDDAALAERVAAGREHGDCAACIALEYGAERDIRVALPTLTFDGRLSFDLGGITAELHHIPTDHSDDVVAVHIPEEAILFLSDATGPAIYAPTPYYTAQGTLQLAAFIHSFAAEHYVLSHCEPTDAAGFWAANEVLVVVAELILAGITERMELLTAVRERLGDRMPGDTEEVIDLYLAGGARAGQG